MAMTAAPPTPVHPAHHQGINNDMVEINNDSGASHTCTPQVGLCGQQQQHLPNQCTPHTARRTATAGAHIEVVGKCKSALMDTLAISAAHPTPAHPAYHQEDSNS
eukprot:1160721-Pelagomonas_calceolata.AAC.11